MKKKIFLTHTTLRSVYRHRVFFARKNQNFELIYNTCLGPTVSLSFSLYADEHIPLRKNSKIIFYTNHESRNFFHVIYLFTKY